MVYKYWKHWNYKIMNSKKTCLNCGKYNHIFSKCKMPITSIGIIAFRFRSNGEPEYLMIQRRDTLGYVDFMRGKYQIYNKDYLLNIINEMTLSEKQKLLNMTFETCWKKLWGRYHTRYQHEKQISKHKYLQLKRGIIIDNELYTLEKLIEESSTQWKEPEYGFPKGRRSNNENDFQTGIREFCEETGYQMDDINIIENISPFYEIFTGSNFKSYKHTYYIAHIHNNTYLLDNYQRCEVGNIKWLSYDECIQYIRPYNIERLQVLKQVHTMLKQSNFV